MSGQRPEAVTFHDVSTCFSDEEWKLLHQWQKDLYRNVMKEIHQALISLGPLIATTVCSLRAKEKEEWCNQDAERKQGGTIPNPDLLFVINEEENLCLNNPRVPEGREIPDHCSKEFPLLNTAVCLRKEEQPVSIFIDHFGEEVRESSADPNSGHEVISFHIKDEEEAYCMDHHDSKRTDRISSPTGDGIMSRKSKAGGSEKCTVKTTPYKISSGKDKVRVLHNPENRAHNSSHLWSENTQELGGGPASQPKSGSSNAAHFCLSQEPPKVHRSEKYNDWKRNLSHNNPHTCQADLQHNWSLYSCTECEKSFSTKENLMKHKRIHTGVRPYQCTECEKSFIRKENLIVHKRIHTGERPYHCIMCNKSFSQKGILSRHQTTHIGERPYLCTECGKRFSLKGNLIAHQKTHIQNRLHLPL